MTRSASFPDAKTWGALAGLRVLDFTQALAGPYCTQMLADHGATVIKVEPIERGDSTRQAGPHHPSDATKVHSGYFHSVNRNKGSIALNLKSAEGRDIILRLVKDCDVVVENFRAGTLERLGLSYEELCAANPTLIYGALRGFGDPRSGASPYVNWPAYDVVAQAMGGICSITGPGPGQPIKIGPGVGDIIPGMFLAFGIMAALYHRNKTGHGQFVDVAMADAILAITERIAYQLSFAGVNPGPPGNHQPFMAPFGIFPVADGHVAIAATNVESFKTLCTAIEAPKLAEDPRFSTNPRRGQYRDELIEELSARLVHFSKAELTKRLGGIIPFGPLYDIADIANDPHFAAREMLARLDIPDLTSAVSVAGVPVKMSETPGGVHRYGPALGELNDEVLRHAGFSDVEIEGLRERGVVK